jgi:metallo-beta-lactamase family protein
MDERSAPVLTFLGAAGTVTGSRFVVDTPTQRVLVDCGQFQGPKDLRQRNWGGVGVGPASVDAVVLTHAHVDHCGMLPVLVRDGFRGPIFCTPSTADLVSIVLPDSGRLAEEEARFANRHGYSKHAPALPLFTEHDAMVALDSLVRIPFGTVHERHDWSFRLGRAGHILGAAWAHLTVGDAGRSVVFTGDLGRTDHPLLSPPEHRPSAHVVVTESTYGNRDHPADDPAERLAEVIRRTIGRGGSVVIPAFAVDRTDVVLHHLHRLRMDGAIPEVPIYLDSPMASKALAIYATVFEEGSPDVRPELVGTHPFAVDGLHVVTNVEESKRLNDNPRPMVIISASGMLTGGRVVHHVAHRIGDERNSVALIGSQAVGTRGRRLLNGEHTLKMLGHYWPVRAEVAHIPTMSVHADRNGLVDWIASGPDDPEIVYAVHGEPDAAAGLVELVEQRLHLPAVAPAMGERVLLD